MAIDGDDDDDEVGDAIQVMGMEAGAVSVTVRATDNGGLYVDTELTVTVDGAPEVETALPSSYEIEQNTTPETIVDDLNRFFKDAEADAEDQRQYQHLVRGRVGSRVVRNSHDCERQRSSSDGRQSRWIRHRHGDSYGLAGPDGHADHQGDGGPSVVVSATKRFAPRNGEPAGFVPAGSFHCCARHGLTPGGAACAEHAKSSTGPAGGTVS